MGADIRTHHVVVHVHPCSSSSIDAAPKNDGQSFAKNGIIKITDKLSIADSQKGCNDLFLVLVMCNRKFQVIEAVRQ